jgi:hypothetical protein
VKGWIDPKTASKVIFMSGDISDNSPNDLIMKDIVGDNWKVLTGAGMPITTTGQSEKHGKPIAASPGYDHSQYWPTVLDREARYWSQLNKQNSNTRGGGGGGGEAHGSSSSVSSKVNHETLSSSNKFNKLIVGRRKVLEFNGEKWLKYREFCGVDHGFLNSFDWQSLRKEETRTGDKRSTLFVGRSSNQLFTIRELTDQFHTWLLSSTMSYIEHVMPYSSNDKEEKKKKKHEDLESMEEDTLLFRIFAHFKEPSSGKIFVALANNADLAASTNSKVNELQVSIYAS